MPWTPSPELNEQAGREVERLRLSMHRAQETERARLAEQLFEGTPNSAAFMAAVETDITNRLTSFGTDLVGTCLDLARMSGAPIDDDLETWVSQFFENYFVASATQFANSITEMRKLRHESTDGVSDHINTLIFSGRNDVKIRFGRLKLEASI